MSLNLSQLNVLIVDDSAFMRRLIREIVEAFDIRNIEECPDGSSALELLTEWPADIAFVDWFMEPMSGLEFTRQIRMAETSPNPYLPIVMITAETGLVNVEEARDVGVTEYLAKPISAQAVYTRLRAVIENPREYIRKDDYFGPSRRRSLKDFTGEDKRGEGIDQRPTVVAPEDSVEPDSEITNLNKGSVVWE